MTAIYDKLELHLAALPLSRRHSKLIKACGGKYSECRSPYANKRFVTVPAAERTLIDELVRTYRNGPKMTMIARGGVRGYDNRPAWVVVQYVDPTADMAPTEQFARKLADAYVQATQRGLISNN